MKSTNSNFSGTGNIKGILAFMLAAVFSPAAVSDIGSINLIMKANLVSNACTITPGTMNQTVDLGTWAVKQFKETPRGVPPKRFVINLIDCGPLASGVKVKFSGTVDPVNNTLFKLDAGSTATNLGISVLDRNKSVVRPNTETIVYPLRPDATNVTLEFYAQYVATANSVGAGTANSQATFTLEYL
ncbi:fimbrial protein [Morganella morganii]|uniref:fimbrial protein n=1 Tax=Morganella morganii TaxID=582 RepID=UPI00277CDF8E|nr:type 1 fimbrial protein [Morganella morganii subsp. morganii]HDU8493885.1 type 1 fimbrial protein [Morganella morganii]